MSYTYTTEGCFKGELLKQPPLPVDNPDVQQVIKTPALQYLKRRWLHYGCAVEELGRFGCYMPDTDVKLSALVWHLHDQLTNPQWIENNDNFGPVGTDDKGRPIFEPRYVICALVDGQIKSGVADVLKDYFGFEIVTGKH